MTPRVQCFCGAIEMEVHRVGCIIWMANPSVQGPLRCPHCGGSFNSLHNDLCMVCDYWKKRPTESKEQRS